LKKKFKIKTEIVGGVLQKVETRNKRDREDRGQSG